LPSKSKHDKTVETGKHLGIPTVPIIRRKPQLPLKLERNAGCSRANQSNRNGEEERRQKQTKAKQRERRRRTLTEADKSKTEKEREKSPANQRPHNRTSPFFNHIPTPTS
jgi:hypothetical protein